jgi:acetyltransferase-like isoleucine patch superfamily enzyme
MGYLSEEELIKLNFKKRGVNLKISEKASIYDAEKIEIGDNSRIDDFCIISGNLKIGSYCHITPMCLIAGGQPGIEIEDFCTFAYGVKIFAQSDDYSGQTMANSLIPKNYKAETMLPVRIEKYTIVGSGSIIFPGVVIAMGCSIGAMTLVNKSTDPWGIYVGVPAKRIKERKKNLLKLVENFKNGEKNDTLQ